MAIAIPASPSVKEILIGFLNDSRPAVNKEAAAHLSLKFPDAQSLAAIQSTIQKRRNQGASDEELGVYFHIVQQIEGKLANATEGPPK